MPFLNKKSTVFENLNVNQSHLKNCLSFEVLSRQDDPSARLKFIQSVFYWFDHWQGWQQRYFITKLVDSLPCNKLIFLKSVFQWVNIKSSSKSNDVVSKKKRISSKEDKKLKETNSKLYNIGLIKVNKSQYSNYDRARWLLNHYIALLQQEYINGNKDINEVNEVENNLRIPADSEYVPSFTLPFVEEVQNEVEKLTLDHLLEKLSECKAKKKQ